MLKRKFSYIFILFLLFLSGCKEVPKGVNILFFSNIPPSFEETLEQELSKKLNGQIDVNIHLYPLSREKFAVLLSQKSGDIYVTDQEYISTLIGKDGLTSLDVLLPPQTDKYFEPYIEKDKETGKSHLYGVPLRYDLSLFNQVEINKSGDLAAIIPAFSNQKEASIEVMENILEIEGGE